MEALMVKNLRETKRAHLSIQSEVYERLLKRAHARQSMSGVITELLDLADSIEGTPIPKELKSTSTE